MEEEELDFDEEPDFGINSLLYDTSDNVDIEDSNDLNDNKSNDSDVDEDDEEFSDKENEDNDKESDEKAGEKVAEVDEESNEEMDEEVYEEASEEFPEVFTEAKEDNIVIDAQFSDSEEEVVINEVETTKTNEKPLKEQSVIEDSSIKAIDNLESFLEIFESPSETTQNLLDSSKNLPKPQKQSSKINSCESVRASEPKQVSKHNQKPSESQPKSRIKSSDSLKSTETKEVSKTLIKPNEHKLQSIKDSDSSKTSKPKEVSKHKDDSKHLQKLSEHQSMPQILSQNSSKTSDSEGVSKYPKKPSEKESVKDSGHQSLKPSKNQLAKPSEQLVKASKHQSAKTPEHQSVKPSEQPVKVSKHQSTKTPEHQLTKTSEQSVKTSKNQLTKPSEHQSVKTPEHQLTKPSEPSVKSSGHQSKPRISILEPLKVPVPKVMSKPQKANEPQPKSSLTPSLRNLMNGSNTALLEKAIIERRKTVELDRKYYESMRIYLREGKIIGYNEDNFKVEAKSFRLKAGKLYFQQNKEVIDTELRQTEIATEYHINAKAKTEKSRHRGVEATVRDIQRHYFWGTIKFDVENVINKCRVCNPLEYDLTAYQLWKYIEIGVIESVLIVRDLNQKSSIFSCAFLGDLTPDKLSTHLLCLFKTYGTPNAIRFVLNEQSKTGFIQEFSDCLKSGLLLFIEEIEFVSHNSAQNKVIKLPMVDIKVQNNSQKCPKNEKELDTICAPIDADEEITIVYIFCCNKWLINESFFNTIASDIKSFIEKFPDWETRISSLSLYFQINGTNLKANEEEEEVKEVPTQKAESKELMRLKRDTIVDYYDKKREKRASKPIKRDDMVLINDDSSSVDFSDDNLSISSSKHSVLLNKTDSKRNLEKVVPFREQLREQKKSIEVIDVDESSQQSVLSSRISASSSAQTPEPILETIESSKSETNVKSMSDLSKYDRYGICQPCLVRLKLYSEKYIENVIECRIDFQESDDEMVAETDTQDIQKSPEILGSDSSDSGVQPMEETVEEMRKSVEQKEVKQLNDNKRKATAVFNLSESGSSDEDDQQKVVPNVSSKSPEKPKPVVIKKTTIVTQVVATPPRNKRKRNPLGSNKSDDDSDYDVRKDLNLGNRTSKRPKTQTNNSNKKSSNNPKPKKTDKRISKRLVASDSSDSESDDDKRKQFTKISTNNLNLKNNSKNKDSISEKETEKTIQLFKCTRCEFSSNERQTLLLHTVKHRNEPKSQVLCQICLQAFNSKEELERHKDAEHPPVLDNKILFGCDKCKDFFCHSEGEMDRHLISEHIEDLSYMKTTSKFRCSMCKAFSAANMELMSAHLVQKHRSFKCAFDCPFVAQDFQTLERHAKSIHSRYGRPFRCKYCDYCTSVFGSLVKHRENSHVLEFIIDSDNNSLNKCGLCDVSYGYDDTNNIIDHLTTHSIDFSYFVCKSCNKRIRSFSELKKHCCVFHGVGPAEGLEDQIANISDLFKELCQQLIEKKNVLAKHQSTNETQNAIAGLMDEHFVEHHDQTTNDLVAAAFDIAINGDFEGEPPTIRIEDNGEDYDIIEENDDGLWNPVNH